MKVREITEAVLALNGGKKFDETCDQLIEGDWESKVTGLAVTFMATVDVIRKAAAAGCNMIITHEPTYFTGADSLEWLRDDAVYHAKKALIDDNNISIWRYHDHMHAGTTDQIYDGLMEILGWRPYLDTKLPQPHCYDIPPATVSQLADFFKEKLGMEVIQILGSPETLCRRVAVLVGGGSLGLGQEEMPAKLMNDENLDVIICGEITEWTLPSYVRDAAALGFGKALVILGHERTEEPGMEWLAEILRPVLKDTPVRFIDSGEPFAYL